MVLQQVDEYQPQEAGDTSQSYTINPNSDNRLVNEAAGDAAYQDDRNTHLEQVEEGYEEEANDYFPEDSSSRFHHVDNSESASVQHSSLGQSSYNSHSSKDVENLTRYMGQATIQAPVRIVGKISKRPYEKFDNRKTAKFYLNELSLHNAGYRIHSQSDFYDYLVSYMYLHVFNH